MKNTSDKFNNETIGISEVPILCYNPIKQFPTRTQLQHKVHSIGVLIHIIKVNHIRVWWNVFHYSPHHKNLIGEQGIWDWDLSPWGEPHHRCCALLSTLWSWKPRRVAGVWGSSWPSQGFDGYKAFGVTTWFSCAFSDNRKSTSS